MPLHGPLIRKAFGRFARQFKGTLSTQIIPLQSGQFFRFKK